MKENNGLLFIEWRKKAEEDLASAKILLEHNGAGGTICFLCQQAAEKILKGFLAYHSRSLLKIHQLDKLLLDCIEIDEALVSLKEPAISLNDYYIETRYPADMPEGISVDQAKEAVRMADSIFVGIIAKVG